jgi:hypothetical protein
MEPKDIENKIAEEDFRKQTVRERELEILKFIRTERPCGEVRYHDTYNDGARDFADKLTTLIECSSNFYEKD